jgi:signal transduction histidine kinase
MKIRNRIAFSTSIIVAITLTGASALIYWNVWREDQGGNYESTTKSLLISLFLLVTVGTISSFFLGRYLSKRALNPVQDLIFQVEQATEESRVQVSNPSDDIGKIAYSLNGLLDRLQASSANQKRFTADAGHELRGPLTTMQLSIDSLRASQDSSELKDISTEIGRLAKLCNDLLDLSRVDGQEVQKSKHRLIDVVEEQLKTFGNTDKQIELHLDDSLDQLVSCNRQLFGLAIRNILENAFQFAETRIEVSARLEADGLHLIIKDDGPGVPISENENIFERFYRSEKVRTIGKGGTGLGLSVVSAVMDAHGGKAFSILGASGGEFHLLLM